MLCVDEPTYHVLVILLTLFWCHPGAPPPTQTSCTWVLKESRAVYKAASEGIMNLADKYFEMERSDALQGIELYKENAVLSEKLNNYYSVMQNNPALR